MLKTVSTLSTVLLLINCILYFKSFGKQNKAFKVLCYYLIYSLLIQILTITLNRLKIPNLFLSHKYFIGQFLFLSIFYQNVLVLERHKKLIRFFIFFTLLAVGTIFYLDPSSYFKFNLLEVIIVSIPIIIFSVLYFIQSMNNTKSFIYINSGIFIYLVASTFLFSAGNFINSSQSTLKNNVWALNAMIYLSYQVLIFIEWYQHFRKRK